jgi:GH25 family lysozyme M1 (1,4-beta-N-acetylmuramidase)
MSRIRRLGIALLAGALTASGLGSVARLPASALAPSGYSVTGVDVSAYQGAVDWTAVAGAGVRFAYIRASEQAGIADGSFATNYSGAKANGLYAGAYHRARPDVSGGKAQADYLADHAQFAADGRTLPLMLDIEWPRPGWIQGDPACYNLTAGAMVTWVRNFVNEVAVRTGRMAMLYTNTNWWNQCTAGSSAFGAYPLFVANYQQSPPPLPSGWQKWTLWQYTSSATVTGITGNVDQDVFNGNAAALTRLADPTAISLLARANNRYVTAASAGTEPLIADRTAIGSWEQFSVVDAGSGFVGLLAHADRRYVTAESAGSQPLIANRTAIGSWEKFRIVSNADGTVSLLANANNRYVTAEGAGTKPLIANRTAIGTWEKFDRVSPPATVGLRAAVNSRYVTAASAGSQPLIASSVGIGSWEQFDMVAAGGGYVALLAHADNRYVTAESAGTKPLIANRTAIGTWEKFRVIRNADDTISLFANANNRFVTAENAGTQPLIANRTAIGTWEKFFQVTY